MFTQALPLFVLFFSLYLSLAKAQEILTPINIHEYERPNSSQLINDVLYEVRQQTDNSYILEKRTIFADGTFSAPVTLRSGQEHIYINPCESALILSSPNRLDVIDEAAGRSIMLTGIEYFNGRFDYKNGTLFAILNTSRYVNGVWTEDRELRVVDLDSQQISILPIASNPELSFLSDPSLTSMGVIDDLLFLSSGKKFAAIDITSMEIAWQYEHADTMRLIAATQNTAYIDCRYLPLDAPSNQSYESGIFAIERNNPQANEFRIPLIKSSVLSVNPTSIKDANNLIWFRDKAYTLTTSTAKEEYQINLPPNSFMQVSTNSGYAIWGYGEQPLRSSTTKLAVGNYVQQLPTLEMTVARATEKSKKATLKLNLFKTSTSSVTFRLTSSDNSAIAGEDYLQLDQFYTIPANTKELSVDIPIISDSILEATEFFEIQISSLEGAIAKNDKCYVIIDEAGIKSESTIITNQSIDDNLDFDARFIVDSYKNLSSESVVLLKDLFNNTFFELKAPPNLLDSIYDAKWYFIDGEFYAIKILNKKITATKWNSQGEFVRHLKHEEVFGDGIIFYKFHYLKRNIVVSSFINSLSQGQTESSRILKYEIYDIVNDNTVKVSHNIDMRNNFHLTKSLKVSISVGEYGINGFFTYLNTTSLPNPVDVISNQYIFLGDLNGNKYNQILWETDNNPASSRFDVRFTDPFDNVLGNYAYIADKKIDLMTKKTTDAIVSSNTFPLLYHNLIGLAYSNDKISVYRDTNSQIAYILDNSSRIILQEVKVPIMGEIIGSKDQIIITHNNGIGQPIAYSRYEFSGEISPNYSVTIADYAMHDYGVKIYYQSNAVSPDPLRIEWVSGQFTNYTKESNGVIEVPGDDLEESFSVPINPATLSSKEFLFTVNLYRKEQLISSVTQKINLVVDAPHLFDYTLVMQNALPPMFKWQRMAHDDAHFIFAGYNIANQNEPISNLKCYVIDKKTFTLKHEFTLPPESISNLVLNGSTLAITTTASTIPKSKHLGSLHVFDINTGGQIFNFLNKTKKVNYGYSLAANNKHVAVGFTSVPTYSEKKGTIYGTSGYHVFDISTKKLILTSTAKGVELGYSIALYDGHVFAGAPEAAMKIGREVSPYVGGVEVQNLLGAKPKKLGILLPREAMGRFGENMFFYNNELYINSSTLGNPQFLTNGNLFKMTKVSPNLGIEVIKLNLDNEVYFHSTVQPSAHEFLVGLQYPAAPAIARLLDVRDQTSSHWHRSVPEYMGFAADERGMYYLSNQSIYLVAWKNIGGWKDWHRGRYPNVIDPDPYADLDNNGSIDFDDYADRYAPLHVDITYVSPFPNAKRWYFVPRGDVAPDVEAILESSVDNGATWKIDYRKRGSLPWVINNTSDCLCGTPEHQGREGNDIYGIQFRYRFKPVSCISNATPW